MAEADEIGTTPAPNPPKPPRRIRTDVPPQQSIDEFWKTFCTKQPGKVFTILPDNLYAKRASLYATWKSPPAKNAVASYEEAAAACQAKVEKIARDCRRLNQKYKDPHFDIEFDFLRHQWYGRSEDCLVALNSDEEDGHRPMSVKRVELRCVNESLPLKDIFDEPHFYIEGATAGDVRQGRDGDCWFMSSICTLSNKENLLERVCVGRDEKVGVYGFVFHRDGEWISEVIDDKLYLIKEDWEEAFWERFDWLQVDMPNQEEEYRKVMQSGSKALYFAQCRDQNETWLPLLEKAYAKAHGDYATIEGGWVGEGLEDLTGGVTSELFSTDILDKDKFWNDELMNVNKTFLFGLAQMGGVWGERKGIIEQHAYSIMEARELDNFRLLKIRNPWGKKEWEGAWSDGSEQWTPDRMQRLAHQFGNDGVFWISYKDLLKNFQHIDRTRLFGSDWSITQQWTSVNVPWSVNYLATHFKIVLPKAARVVIVLSQLDERYFNGLTGQYDFQLQFRVHRDGAEEYIVRSNPSYFMNRSVNTELDLEAGTYTVIFKITATRDKEMATPEEVIRKNCEKRPEKLLAVGLSYDLAHAKGRLKESARERKQRLQEERREKRRRQARKNFDARRISEKKDKLTKKRQEAKEKAKKKDDGDSAPAPPNKQVSVTVQVGDNTVSISKPQGVDEAEGGATSIKQEISGRRVKVSIDPSKWEESAKEGGGESKSEGTQASAGAQEGDKPSEDPEAKDGSTQDSTAETAEAAVAAAPESASSSGVGVTPSTSEASATTGDDSKKADTAEPDTASKPGDEKVATASTAKETDSSDKPPATDESVDPSPQTKEITDPAAQPSTITLSDISDDGLSWASDLDAPSDTSSSDSDSDSDPGPANTSSDSTNNPSTTTVIDDPASDPWNAVAVVGLRVYCRGSQAEIEIVPGQDAAKASGRVGVDRKHGIGARVPENKKLDVDDQAADATKGLGRSKTVVVKPGEEGKGLVPGGVAAEEKDRQG